MSASGYYPAGAYNDPRAPYNQPETEEEDFDMYLTYTISTDVKFSTERYERDFDGYTYPTEPVEDWKAEHYTPCQLINELKGYLEKHLTTAGRIESKELKKMLKDAELYTVKDKDGKFICESIEIE